LKLRDFRIVFRFVSFILIKLSAQILLSLNDRPNNNHEDSSRGELNYVTTRIRKCEKRVVTKSNEEK